MTDDHRADNDRDNIQQPASKRQAWICESVNVFFFLMKQHVL